MRPVVHTYDESIDQFAAEPTRHTPQREGGDLEKKQVGRAPINRQKPS
jgi:hypothetical protein